MLQYNLTPSSKSQYNIVLQYKLSPQAFFSAIQYSVLQYNFPLFSSLLLCNTMTVLQYNFLYFKPSLQYNPAIQSCNTTEPSSLQYKKLYCNIVSKPTTPILQYNPSSLFPAIQYLYCNTLHPSSPFKLQYKPCLATQIFHFSQYNLGSSPSKFSAQQIFFSFFIINDFFFHLFPEIGKISKNH